MLTIMELIDVVLQLRDRIPEPARSEVAHKLADNISSTLLGTRNYKPWIEADRFKFLQKCELVDVQSWVPDSLHVEPSKLKDFCTKWTTTNIMGDKVLTPDMNRLRSTMLKELTTIALDR